MVLVVSRVVDGGDAPEKGVERYEAIVEDLRKGGFLAERVAVSGMSQLYGAFDRYGPDMAFCSFHRFEGAGSSDARLMEACIASGIAWIGSTTETMDLALSKPRMKDRLRRCGIPTPDWLVVSKKADGSIEGLEILEAARDFPYIVKPANEGNSRGIDDGSVVRAPHDLFVRASLIAEEYGEAIVERYVSGGDDSREFTVAMIGNGADAIVSPVEISRRRARSLVITEEDKESEAVMAAPIDDERLKAEVGRLARKVFLASGARDYARCDILFHEDKLYAIEMNGQPIVPDSWFAACSREVGLDEPQYINAIALAAIAENARSGHALVSIPRGIARLLPRDVFERLARS